MENESLDLTGIRLTYSSNSSEETGLFEKGTLLKGKCMDGYVMKGKNQDHIRPLRKKCRRNGEWVGRGDDMKCELITCPPLRETGYLSEDVIAPIEKCSGGVTELLDGSGRTWVGSSPQMDLDGSGSRCDQCENKHRNCANSQKRGARNETGTRGGV